MGNILKIKTTILSYLIRRINTVNYHNLAKFLQINKIWNNIKMDSIEGDYIEFGIFKGKSLYHSFKSGQIATLREPRVYWGLDSFEGFPVENHDFYVAENFKSSKQKVLKTFNKYDNVKIIDGFFETSLKQEEVISIKSISFAFVDCDIYESAEVAFNFIKERISDGGFIMIDDFTSVDKNGNYIAKCFYKIFEEKTVVFFDAYSNGHTYRIFHK